MSAADVAVSFALSQVGKPYHWGSAGPNKWDCSGLTYKAYQNAGIRIGRVTGQQILNGKAVSASDLRPGDLIFPHPAHVQMYIGNGNIVEAPHTGLDVRTAAIGRVWAARRIDSNVTNENVIGPQLIPGPQGTLIPNPLYGIGGKDLAGAAAKATGDALASTILKPLLNWAWYMAETSLGIALLGLGVFLLFGQSKAVQSVVNNVSG